MHTTHSHLLKLRKAAALCTALFLCACSYERLPDVEEGELMTVTLSAGPAAGEQNLTSKAGLTDTQENSIHDLYILAFQPDATGAFFLKYYATGRSVSGGGGGQFSFTLRRSVSGAADTKLLLVANQNPYPLVNIGMTYEGVQAALTSGELAAPAFVEHGIPMFGFAGNSSDTPLEITEGMPPLSANLLRAVARVDVGVGTYSEQTGEWNKGGVNFDLQKIYVFKPQNKYTLIPVLSNLEYDVNGIPSVTAPSQVGDQSANMEYTITNNTSCKAEIYLPEVALKGGTVYDANHGNRMALVIGGTYQGKPNYYRIDFTTEKYNAENVDLNDVLRNHIYRYSITNVNQSGYNSPEAAYAGRPVGLDFTANIVDWQAESLDSPTPDMFVRLNFGGINGTEITENMTEDGVSKSFKILPKKDQFKTDDGNIKYISLNYNGMTGEARDNTFNGVTNGGTYTDVDDALNREGPYATLIIAPDNASESVQWRSTPLNTPQKNRILDAKKVCWDYRGQGQSDWRLPRLSELMLLWMNKATINNTKGFTSLGDSGETYWTGSEGKNDKVYTVDRNGAIKLVSKTDFYKVRCVRQVRKQN
ncbi:MAG: hypothetical protein ACK5N4_13000 [Parabacteroides gordonii]|uniref:hypothetical protein n=1 Tax=Parabacteroides gordonii TaxID=574930 RepID=UPI003A882A94